MTRSTPYPCVLGAIIVLLCVQLACSFHARLPLRSLSSALRSVTPGDFDGSSIGDAGADAEGQALAKEFYQQVRLREIERENRLRYLQEETPSLSEEEARARNREPFSKRREVRQGKDVSPSNTFSFTGRRPTSAGFFSGDGDSVYSFPSGGMQGASSASSSRPQSMDQDFRLLGTTEQTLFIQGVVVSVVLSLYIAVGVAGDITNSVVAEPIEWIMGNSDAPVVEMKHHVKETAHDASVWI